MLLIDNPDATLDEIMDVLPGPDFPTGGIICGRLGIRQGYHDRPRRRSRSAPKVEFETEKNTDVIVVTEIPYQETRDRIREKLEELVRDDKIKGISRDRRLHRPQDARRGRCGCTSTSSATPTAKSCSTSSTSIRRCRRRSA